jgi:hypothetical protein
MQREKLYNLHKTATFTVAHFVLKIDKILNDQISMLQKSRFLVWDEPVFYLIYHLVCFIQKKQNTPQDAA